MKVTIKARIHLDKTSMNQLMQQEDRFSMKSMFLTSSSSSTCWQRNLFAPLIAAPKSAILGKLKSPICLDCEEDVRKHHLTVKISLIYINYATNQS